MTESRCAQYYSIPKNARVCPGSIPASLAVTGASRSDAILRSTCGEQLVYLRLGVPVNSSLEQATFLNGRSGRDPSERGMFTMGWAEVHACIYLFFYVSKMYKKPGSCPRAVS